MRTRHLEAGDDHVGLVRVCPVEVHRCARGKDEREQVRSCPLETKNPVLLPLSPRVPSLVTRDSGW